MSFVWRFMGDEFGASEIHSRSFRCDCTSEVL